MTRRDLTERLFPPSRVLHDFVPFHDFGSEDLLVDLVSGSYHLWASIVNCFPVIQFNVSSYFTFPIHRYRFSIPAHLSLEISRVWYILFIIQNPWFFEKGF